MIAWKGSAKSQPERKSDRLEETFALRDRRDGDSFPPMNERIVTDPAICSGKPVIRGTRIMVKNILGLVAGGYTLDRIVLTYPELAKEDVSAALEYAASVVAEEQVYAHA